MLPTSCSMRFGLMARFSKNTRNYLVTDSHPTQDFYTSFQLLSSRNGPVHRASVQTCFQMYVHRSSSYRK